MSFSPADSGAPVPQTRRERRAAQDESSKKEASAPRKRRRVIGIVIAAVLAIAVLAVCWLVFRALTVKSELEASQRIVAEVQNGDAEIAAALPELGEHASAAAGAAGDPVWRLAEVIPGAGDNLRGVRLAAESLDLLANDLGQPLFAAFEGDSDRGLIAVALPLFETAAPDVTRLADGLDEVREGALLDPVRAGVEQVGDVMSAMAPTLSMLPDVLGANGERHHLLVFQNNAESVGLGGSAASQTLIRADGGELEMVHQANSDQYKNGTAVDVEVPESATDLYTRYLVDHINTSASRPDFPTMAEIVTAWWQRDIRDDQIDGVLSADPLALARMLSATGPIELSTGDVLTEDNAVDLLLREAYERWGTQETKFGADAFFASVAEQVFSKIASGDFDAQKMIVALGESIETGSLLFYSADDEVQQIVEPLKVSGILPATNDEQTTVGVYFRDESGSKIDYYMDSAVAVAASCADGRRSFDVSAQLHLDISPEEAAQLPPYVRSQNWGIERFRTQVDVYGPPGTSVESTAVDGRQVELRSDNVDDLGRPVASFWTYLSPGESAEVTATFSGDDGDYGALDVRTTPMIQPTDVTTESAGCAAPSSESSATS